MLAADLVGLPSLRASRAHHTPQEVNSGLNWKRAREDVEPAAFPAAGMRSSFISGPERPRTSTRGEPRIPRRPTTPPAALSTSSSERWLQIRDELGETKEEIFIGNNLRDVRARQQSRAPTPCSPPAFSTLGSK